MVEVFFFFSLSWIVLIRQFIRLANEFIEMSEALIYSRQFLKKTDESYHFQYGQ